MSPTPPPLPCVVEVIAGESYRWCACGRSATQPFCDDSHSGSGIEPLLFTAKRSERVWLCACKRTRRPPYCDGTHNKLKEFA